MNVKFFVLILSTLMASCIPLVKAVGCKNYLGTAKCRDVISSNTYQLSEITFERSDFGYQIFSFPAPYYKGYGIKNFNSNSSQCLVFEIKYGQCGKDMETKQINTCHLKKHTNENGELIYSDVGNMHAKSLDVQTSFGKICISSNIPNAAGNLVLYFGYGFHH